MPVPIPDVSVKKKHASLTPRLKSTKHYCAQLAVKSLYHILYAHLGTQRQASIEVKVKTLHGTVLT